MNILGTVNTKAETNTLKCNKANLNFCGLLNHVGLLRVQNQHTDTSLLFVKTI